MVAVAGVGFAFDSAPGAWIVTTVGSPPEPLELNAESLTERPCVVLPREPKELDAAGIGREQPFANLDRRRLAGAVGAEQAEALPRCHGQVEAVDRANVSVILAELANEKRVRHEHPGGLVVLIFAYS